MTSAESIKTLRIAFLGTYHPAVPTLRKLASREWVTGVILPQESGPKNDELLTIINEFQLDYSYQISDIDSFSPNLLLACNFPKLVPSKYLSQFPCINTHWSLLPKWRGIHPTAWALINGDEEIGLSVHMMEEDFDTGDILAQDSVSDIDDMTFNEIHEILAEKQADAVVKVLEAYLETGELKPIVQDHSLATYIPQRIPEDGIIHWDWPAKRIESLAKALPLPKYPGAYSFLGQRKVILLGVKCATTPEYFSTSGQVVRIMPEGAVWIKAKDTCIVVEEIMFEDEGKVIPASKVLKRGVKLGFDPQLEIARLQERVATLENKLHLLLNKINT